MYSNAWVSPSLVSPKRWAEHAGLTTADLKAIRMEHRKAMQGIPERFREFVADPVHLRVFTWYGAQQDGLLEVPYEAPALRTLGAPLDRAPATSGKRRGSVEGAHWPDAREWGVVTRELMTDLSVLMERKLTPQERTQLEASAESFRQLVEMTHQMPEQIFGLGTLLWLLGQDEEAAACFHTCSTRSEAQES